MEDNELVTDAMRTLFESIDTRVSVAASVADAISVGTADPAALDPYANLSGTTGPVLDPVFSLRCRVRVPAGGSVTVAFSTGLAETRDPHR